MHEDPAKDYLDKAVGEFFNQLRVQNQYYSLQLKQPVLLIGENDLYKAIKKTIENANNHNNQNKEFKQLSVFTRQNAFIRNNN